MVNYTDDSWNSYEVIQGDTGRDKEKTRERERQAIDIIAVKC